MSSTLTTEQDPNSAVLNLILHDHSDGALGAPIPETGLANASVSTRTLQDDAVTGSKIAPLTITEENVANSSITLAKLGADVQMANSGGIIGVTNYIGNGLKITPSFTTQEATIEAGRASLGEKNHTLATPYLIPLTTRMATLAYAQYSENTTVPIIGKVDAQYPSLESDHVGRWIFNAKTNGTTVLDTSTSANHLTVNGGVTLVDGWADYGMKLDGTTGYLTSVGTTGLPVGGSVRSMTMVVTFHQLLTVRQSLFSYGSEASYSKVYLFYNPSGFLGYDHYGTLADTLFSPQIGQTYIITMTHDGAITKIYVNGTLVFSKAFALTTVAGTMNVGKYQSSVGELGFITVHYLDVRNTCLSADKVGLLANKALFPNTHQTIGASYPALTKALTHEYRFNEASGTSVVDTGNTTAFSGAMGTANVIVDSGLMSGKKALKFDGTANSKVVVNQPLQLSNSFSFVAVVKPTDVASYRPMLGNGNVLSQGFYVGLENIATNPRVGIYDYGSATFYYSTTRIDPTINNFVALTLDNRVLTMYINSIYPDSVQKFIPSAGALTAMSAYAIGAGSSTTVSASYFNGVIEYLAWNNQAVLSQEEVELNYNNLMLGNISKRITDDVLPSPTNSVALGLIRTNSNGCCEVNDADYKYGRNEGAIRAEGNKRVFLGWKWMTVSQTKFWENPFDTDQVDFDIIFKKKMTDYGINVNPAQIYSTDGYGLYKAGVTQHNISVYSGTTALVWANFSYDNVQATSGWVGVWAYLL